MWSRSWMEGWRRRGRRRVPKLCITLACCCGCWDAVTKPESMWTEWSRSPAALKRWTFLMHYPLDFCWGAFAWWEKDWSICLHQKHKINSIHFFHFGNDAVRCIMKFGLFIAGACTMMVTEQTQSYRISFELIDPNQSNPALLVPWSWSSTFSVKPELMERVHMNVWHQ